MDFVSVCNRLRYRTTLLAAASALAVLGLAIPAQAGTIAAAEVGYDNALLSNFNLVTLGDVNALTNTVYTAGRVIVGGNLNVNGVGYGACTSASGPDRCGGNLSSTTRVDASTDPAKQQNYGVLTVFGNVVGTNGAYYGFGFNSGGTAAVAGSASGTLYANGRTDFRTTGATGGLTIIDPKTVTTTTSTPFSGLLQNSNGSTVSVKPTAVSSAATVFPFSNASMKSEIKNLAAGIAKLPGTPGIPKTALPSGNSSFLSAVNPWVSNGKTYGIITTTLQNLASQTGAWGIDNKTYDATFVVVTGTGDYTLPNLNSYAGQNKVIFDFVDATALRFAGVWNASILAPLATITSMGAAGGYIDGTVIVNSINQTNALYATNLFAGNLTGLIPEPASLALFGIGAAAAGLVRRRRRQKLAA